MSQANSNYYGSNVQDVPYVEIKEAKFDEGNYPKKVIENMKLMRQGDYAKVLLKRSKAGMRGATIGVALGLFFAFRKRGNYIIYAMIGAGIGAIVGNVIDKKINE